MKLRSVTYLGPFLKQARLESGLTQHQVQESTGIATTHISSLERGRVNIGIKRLIALTDLYNYKIVLEPEPPAWDPRRKKKKTCPTCKPGESW